MSFYLESMQKLKQQACCPVQPKFKKTIISLRLEKHIVSFWNKAGDCQDNQNETEFHKGFLLSACKKPLAENNNK
jgi:hypothetical protein